MPYNKFYIGSELVNDIIQPGIVKEGILYNIDVNLNTISTSSLTASYPGIEIPAEPTQSWGSFAFDNVEFSNGSRAYYYTSSIEIPTTFVLNSASMYRADSDQFEFTWTFWINPNELGYTSLYLFSNLVPCAYQMVIVSNSPMASIHTTALSV